MTLIVVSFPHLLPFIQKWKSGNKWGRTECVSECEVNILG